MPIRLVALLCLLLVAICSPAHAQPKSDGKPAEPEAPSVTEHEVTIGGQAVRYTATAGYLRLPDYEGKPKADVFFVAYTRRHDSPQPGRR
jgi:carboxypeptidase C (cathepsin A)